MKESYFGLVKTTLADYPGEVAATIFMPYCNLRCPFCHNPELVLSVQKKTLHPKSEVLSFLQRRSDVLTGVCITGGEPLMHNELDEIIRFIKDLGLRVKVDTNGCFPDKLANLDVDYIAMDIKTSLHRYKELGTEKVDALLTQKINKSIQILLKRNSRYEFRSTFAPHFLELDDLKSILNKIQGTTLYSLNAYKSDITLDPQFQNYPLHTEDTWIEAANIIKASGIPHIIRKH